MAVPKSSFVRTLAVVLAACLLLIGVHAVAEDQTPQRPSWYARDRMTDLTLEDPAYRSSAAYQALRRRYQSKLADAQAHPERAGAIASELWSELRDYPLFTGTSEGQENAKLGLEMYAEIVAIWERQHPQQNTRDGTRFIPGGPPAAANSDAKTRDRLPANVGGNPQNNNSTITGGDYPLDPYGAGPVLEIVRDANNGAVVDVSKLMRQQSANRGGNGQPDDRVKASRFDSSKSSQQDSTITTKYDPVTENMARETVARYGSIPGGLLFEGESGELAPARNVKYLAKANVFILDDTVVYPNPVQETEFLEIYRAIAQDDRLGVSFGFGDEKRILFGKLPPDGKLAMNLFVADGFLGDIVFGYKRFTSGYVHAPGYDPSESYEAISFFLKVLGYRFTRNDAGVMVRTDTNIQTTLIPISQARAKNGGALPDFSRIRSGDVSATNVGRVRHLNENFAYYARERILRMALGYGEAAAFARLLKAKGMRVAGLR